MTNIIEIIQTKPYAVSIFTLMLVAMSPSKKETSALRWFLYLVGSCVGIGLAAIGLIYDNSAYPASLATLMILGYQARLLKKIRGPEAESDFKSFKRLIKIRSS